MLDERLKAWEHIYPTRASILSKYSPRTVIDRFSINGPHGSHICVVHQKPPFQPQDVAAADGKMDIESMRQGMKQRLIVADYLHSDCYTLVCPLPTLIQDKVLTLKQT
jgi:non-specific serine/threonine protein kinase